MTEQLTVLETMTASALATDRTPTAERIREIINALRQSPLCCEVDEASAEALARRFEEKLGVVMQLGAMVTDNEYTPWLDEARKHIDPYYWSRYRRLLIDGRLPTQVVAAMDSVSDRILGLLQDPRLEGPWDRRGMVVGQVQSGKTANYVGLICKAADAGYRVIVVIAGIHNNLRNQTQLRIDEGFVGRDSARLLSQKADRYVGVGKYDRTRRPVTFTNSIRDFNKGMATGVGIDLQDLKEPAVFVIKKNSSTLKNLIEWLQEHSTTAGSARVAAPLLVIDDEADNASINISHGKNEVSRINGQIRTLLKMFERSCYVGYTATPFANIFIDPDSDDEMRGADLFPRNFIISLDPPSNYFGPLDVFGDDSRTYVRTISDNEDLLPVRHDKSFRVHGLPASLVRAVNTFVLARAVRLLRGHWGSHNSMLVNVSRFTDVQSQIRNEIHHFVSEIQDSCRINGGLSEFDALLDPRIAELHETWEADFDRTGLQWSDIQSFLHDAAAPVQVVEVNSKAAGTLNYRDHEDSGLNVIAVGGFSLSRGLTLEGLVVSYFLRNSVMYDTLMQMGRWFGYRPDYQDLCRVWMTEEAEGWYAHVTESIEMLREEFRSMERANATPEQFGLKVRSHPDTLIVTARNKLGSGETVVVSVGLANNFVETALLRRDTQSITANIAAGRELAAKAVDFSPADTKAGPLYGGVPVEHVLTFLARFRNHRDSYLTDTGPVRRYIESRQYTELAEWDVLFTSLQNARRGQPDDSLGIQIVPQSRTAGSQSRPDKLVVSSKQRVSSRGVERIGVEPLAAQAAEERYKEAQRQAGKLGPDGKLNYPDWIYRTVRNRPLLIIHLLDVTDERMDKTERVLAWSISFPTTEQEEDRVEYIVNTTWMREVWAEDYEEEMSGDV